MTNIEQKNYSENGINSFSPEVKIKYEELHSTLLDKQIAASEKGEMLIWHDKIVNFANNLLSTYPDARDYLFFHLLIGSTSPMGLSQIDFPGDDSVELFINNLNP